MHRPALVALALLAACAQTPSDPAVASADKVPQPTVTDRSEGRARELCRAAVQTERFTVMEVVEVSPATAGGGQRTGTELTLRIKRLGDERVVRCAFTDATGRVVLDEI